MSTTTAANISRSLAPLREIVESLSRAKAGELPTALEKAKLTRQVRKAGSSALPTLLRALQSTHETEAGWAYYLLAQLGAEKSAIERLASRLAELLDSPSTPDPVKARALGLLSDFKVPPPERVRLRDPEGLLKESVEQLLETLDTPGELAEAVDLILEQVPEAELPAFTAELLRHGGANARRVLSALLKRRVLAGETVDALRLLQTSDPRPRSERTLADALERGLAYLEAGRPRAARRRLERVARSHPRLPEGRSALGICLLQLGEYDAALDELKQAAALQPAEALHQWNLAACAKQCERVGGAYLALREYLQLKDEADGADERRSEARSYVRAYEKMLRDCHPDVSLADYLRGEELFARAYAALSEGRSTDAIRGFQAVLALVPRHYPSWGNLGIAQLQLGERQEAVRCFERALELNPNYTAALQNLAALTEA